MNATEGECDRIWTATGCCRGICRRLGPGLRGMRRDSLSLSLSAQLFLSSSSSPSALSHPLLPSPPPVYSANTHIGFSNPDSARSPASLVAHVCIYARFCRLAISLSSLSHPSPSLSPSLLACFSQFTPSRRLSRCRRPRPLRQQWLRVLSRPRLIMLNLPQMPPFLWNGTATRCASSFPPLCLVSHCRSQVQYLHPRLLSQARLYTHRRCTA